jgi:type III secretion system YscI/HrpB-like protein
MPVMPLAAPLPSEGLSFVPAPLPMPDPAAVGQFETAMATPHGLDQVLGQELNPNLQTLEFTPNSLGERILATFDQMRETHHTTMAEMNGMLSPAAGEKASLPDLMTVYLEVYRLTITEDMLAKLVGKATQNLDTLLKGQ